MSSAAVTFAIPCCDAGAHLQPLLQSLLAQTRQDFALLLVDDASTDDSPATAQAIAGQRLVIHRNPQRLGIAANWNRCVELVTTEHVVLAHQDDVYAPRYLERMLASLAERPDCAAAHCRASTLDAAGSARLSASERYKDRFWRDLARGRTGSGNGNDGDDAGAGVRERSAEYARLLRGNYVIAPSLLYRTRSLRAVGPFSEQLRFVLDWQMHFRMLLEGHGLCAVPERLLGYRRHAQSASIAEQQSLNRYREEHEVGVWARSAGIAAGLLRPGHRASRAWRNDLLRDAYFDLARGERAKALGKLQFARTLGPSFGRDPALIAFRLLASSGRLGKAALGLALRTVAGSTEP